MAALYEEMRPRSWEQVVGQSAALQIVDNCRQRGGLASRAYWIVGPSGSGKTTIARLIAGEVADGWGLTEFDSASEVTAEFIRQATNDKRSRPFGRGYCYVVNEAHGFRQDQVERILGLIESLPAWQTWVFTTTDKGQQSLMFDCDDAGPLMSRCIKLKLQCSEFEFSKNFVKQAHSVGIELTIAEASAIMRRNKGNYRAALVELESKWLCQTVEAG